MPLWSDLKGHFAEAMFGWKWGNLACDSCQRPGGLTGMQIGHTIVALNLPSRSMLRIVTALSWCPPPLLLLPPRNCVCLWGGEMRAGGANRVAIIQQGILSQCKGGRVQGWKWYQFLGCSVWWRCMSPTLSACSNCPVALALLTTSV